MPSNLMSSSFQTKSIDYNEERLEKLVSTQTISFRCFRMIFFLPGTFHLNAVLFSKPIILLLEHYYEKF